jgi:diguanylate cyclase (GGDEF)-like protein
MSMLNASLIPDAEAMASDAARPAGEPSARPQPQLLIVDDIAENRAVLARRFQRRGFKITEAEGGRRALQLIAEQSFDVVLLDVMMPDIDGLDVLRQVRETHSTAALPVIMVTAKSQSEDIVQALEAGANDYVTKPVDFAVALARVNAQVGRKRAEDEARLAYEALHNANENLEHRVVERTSELVAANAQLRDEIAHRLQSEATVRYLAYHDPLTGLGNRVLFREQLEEALLREPTADGGVAVLFFDLDGFKGVNDTLGHSAGDGLLKRAADRLRDSLKERAMIARLGGDEFAVLQVGQAQPASAAALANEVIELLGRPFLLDGQDVAIGASCGIALAPGDSTDPDELLKMADLSMYRAKSDGRGTFRFFEPEMNARAQARRALEQDLRCALAQGAFALHYQPIVSLQTSRITGFEALLRWQHPERGFVPPAEFIPIAEEIGVIGPLGEWALRQACAEAANWPAEIKVAVNLSPLQFRSGNLVAVVVNALAASGLPATRLEVEITESVLLETNAHNAAILNQLRELGVRISLDDFGTGYASLSYLQGFQFDKIKIDRSFVRDLPENTRGLAIVRAIAGLGASFSMTTTAEGVETEEQLVALKREGCTEIQGYFFSPPRPVAEIRALIARQARL